MYFSKLSVADGICSKGKTRAVGPAAVGPAEEERGSDADVYVLVLSLSVFILIAYCRNDPFAGTSEEEQSDAEAAQLKVALERSKSEHSKARNSAHGSSSSRLPRGSARPTEEATSSDIDFIVPDDDPSALSPASGSDAGGPTSSPPAKPKRLVVPSQNQRVEVDGPAGPAEVAEEPKTVYMDEYALLLSDAYLVSDSTLCSLHPPWVSSVVEECEVTGSDLFQSSLQTDHPVVAKSYQGLPPLK